MEQNKTSKVGILVILVKLIPKLLKSAKVLKFGLAGVSLVTYSHIFTWQFAVIIMTMLFVHESGHVWAMKKRGIKTKGFYFIPFVGGAAVAEESLKTRLNEAYIAIMGPVWGFTLSFVIYGVFLLTKDPLFAAASSWMALVNLINLIPVNPLDGGKIVKSLVLSMGQNSTKYKRLPLIILVVISVILLILIAMAGLWLFFFFACIGFIDILYEFFRDKSQMPPMTLKERYQYSGYSFVLAFALYVIMYTTQHVPGADLAMDLLRDK